MTPQEEFQIANRAFEQFTLDEREMALREFATLQYPSVIDRFTECVYRIITSNQRTEHPRVERKD